MKKKVFILLQVLSVVFISSCKEDDRGQYPVDRTPPKKVDNERVLKQFGGGVTIGYDIPDDKDLLYVKATYTLDTGTPMEIKSSLYETQMNIIGFSREGDHQVELRAVDRSQNESEPVYLDIRPLDSPIHAIFQSLSVFSDFGGVQLQWENEEEFDITVMVSKPITAGSELTESVVNFYSKAREGKNNVRGFPSREQEFLFQIQDRWGNTTDVLRDTYLPKYEEECNKARFLRWNGDPDIPYNQYSASWTIENLWNSVYNAGASTGGFHTRTGSDPPATKITFDLGAVYTLSRFKIWHRPTKDWVFTHGNPKKFTLYGSETPAARMEYDNSGNPEHAAFQWKKIGEFDTAKPSGLPVGENSDEDIQVAGVDGIDYTLPIETTVPVRYIRMDVLEMWGGTLDFLHMMEMSFWGEPKTE
ncbi:MAG: DUF4959 domain-containing protein [Bacteroidales bacterium]|jgi:hypothetical protein|nr:DUF4959 domain-containing protein [Bacteroidales bacterium]